MILISRRSAIRAPGYCVLRGDKSCAPFPAPLSLLEAFFLRFAPGRFRLTIPTSLGNIECSVAALRRLIGFLPE